MKRTILLVPLLALSLVSRAQYNEIHKAGIKTLQVVCGDKWLALPIMKLRSDNPSQNRINISFDDLTHTYHRYTYSITHCEADWSPSEQLFASDYIEGFAEDNTIDDITESINTNVDYTHYAFSIPNEKCRLKLSGNYKVTVADGDTGEEVITACFMVVDPKAGISMGATTNTDIDTNLAHQQISMKLSYNALRVADPETQIKTVVMQNRRWDNAIRNAQPQYKTPSGLEWRHNRELIFEAGNEYHKFETLATSHATMGIDEISWDGENYHAHVFADVPRPNYLYDEDANGAFYIRNSDNIENENTCDYMYVHFTLDSKERYPGDIYLNGEWTYDRFLPEYKMEYNEEKRRYEAAILLKQGYYSYQYLMEGGDATMKTSPSEGNFYQTENKYQALVYYRGQGDRTDQLVGYQEIQLNPNGH